MVRSSSRACVPDLTDGPDDVPLCEQMPVKARKKLVLEQLGFECHCAVCEREEAKLA